MNAGRDTISVFAVRGDRLALRQVLGSGGVFPVSVAVHGDLVYVLNALNGGSVQGYRVLGRFLARIPGWHRALGLDPNATPQFTTTPGQVAFTPDGSQVVVTTKGNGNDIDVFGVSFSGRLSAKATVNAEPGTVPFAIAFDPFGHLVIAEAGPNALATFDLSRNGTVSLLSQAGTGQAATLMSQEFGVLRDVQHGGAVGGEQLGHGLVELVAALGLDAGRPAQTGVGGPARVVQ